MFAGGCRCGRYGVVDGDFAVGDADDGYSIDGAPKIMVSWVSMRCTEAW